MNLFSFSLYGEIPKYNIGAIENARIVSELGHGWGSVFYYDDSVPSQTIRRLYDHGAHLKLREPNWHENGMFWRFRITRDFEFRHALIRDVDSRICIRDLSAIHAWIESGKSFHIMRDHPNHRTPILGGLWGASEKIKDLENIWEFESVYGKEIGEDQRFLRDHLYPLVKTESLIHDSFFRFERDRNSFPVKRVGGEYVGESLDEFGNYDVKLRSKLLQCENSFFKRAMLKRPQIN